MTSLVFASTTVARMVRFSVIVAPFSAVRGALTSNPSVSFGPILGHASIASPPSRSGLPRLKHRPPVSWNMSWFLVFRWYGGAVSSLNTMSGTISPSILILIDSIFCLTPSAVTGPMTSIPASSIMLSLSSSYGSVVLVSPEEVLPPADRFVVAKLKSKSIFLALSNSPMFV